MTRLKVYDTPSIDGQISGTPHVHLACSEMYTVLEGQGAVEIIDSRGFSRVDLKPHDTLLFTPGTLHRLINPHRDLVILVVMQNSGLPERGDNVVTFPEATLADAAYQASMRIQSLEDAYRRRDLGVQGFLALKAAFESSVEAGRAALQGFYRLAAARTAHQQDAWREMIQHGAMAAVQRSLAQLDALKQQDVAYLHTSDHVLIEPPQQTTAGFCGHLQRYFDPASLLPEGISST